MKGMGALQASISHAPNSSATAPHSRPASPSAPPFPSEHSSRAFSDSHDESSPEVSSPPGQAHEVSSPQLDQETSDELAALAGWGLDDKAPDDDSDGNITDQDAEGKKDDEYEAPAPPVGTTRPAFKPLARCKTKGAPARHE
jgi:hypothetical protein